jgi:hypothetical protein
MRHLNYTLTPSRINNVKGKAQPYKLTDGGGLYVHPSIANTSKRIGCQRPGLPT